MGFILVLGLPVVVGIAIIMGGEPSKSRGASAIIIALLVFAALIGTIAVYHPPGDYRSHRTSSHQGGRV